MIFALLSYIVLLAGVFFYNYSGSVVLSILIPFYLVFVPLLTRTPLKLNLNREEVCQASVFSGVFLFPFFLVMLITGGRPIIPPMSTVLFHLTVAALPEEIYFRGYLQELIGNNYRGVFIVSVLFAITHFGRYIFSGDLSGLFTFFPSLVMGYLYMKTENLLYPIVFHFFANVLFSLFF